LPDEKAMTEPEILEKLTGIVRGVFANDQIVLTPESTGPEIPGWDSHHYVDIILRIEDALNISVRAREANKARNIGDLVNLIKTKLA
jgi:acyl carrier protein